jgi:two-component system cell cycle response regulator
MRAGDLIARLGGDEFLVIMPNTDATLAELAANRIHNQLAKLRVICDTGEFGLTVSIGITSIDDASLSLEDLVKLGDRALYSAKASGRLQASAAPQTAS